MYLTHHAHWAPFSPTKPPLKGCKSPGHPPPLLSWQVECSPCTSQLAAQPSGDKVVAAQPFWKLPQHQSLFSLDLGSRVWKKIFVSLKEVGFILNITSTFIVLTKSITYIQHLRFWKKNIGAISVQMHVIFRGALGESNEGSRHIRSQKKNT